jgi:hypothetical protein
MKMTAPPGPRSKIYHDPEVRAAVDRLLQRPLTIDAIRTNISARFGQGRTPSRSAVGRYMRRERLGLGYPHPNMSHEIPRYPAK